MAELPNMKMNKNEMPTQDPKVRARNFEEVALGYDEAVAIDDPWIDYAWCIWSLEYNLGTNKYTPELLKSLNIDFDKEKYDKFTTI